MTDPITSYLIVDSYLFSLNEKIYASKLDSSIMLFLTFLYTKSQQFFVAKNVENNTNNVKYTINHNTKINCKMDIYKWSIEDLIDACSSKPSGKKKMEIPKIQRRREWKPCQEDDLIETMKLNKISIGILQVYKIDTIKKSNGEEVDVYLLADGLHRATTLVKYFNNPFCFERTQKLVGNITKDIIGKYQKSYNKDDIEKLCTNWFSFKKLGCYQDFVVDKIFNESYEDLKTAIGKLVNKSDKESVAKYFLEKTRDLSKDINISKSIIPIMLNDDIATLPTLFKRINQNGTPLTACDVLAATWYNNEKLEIKNKKIIECIADHYNELKSENNNMDIYTENNDGNKYTVYEYVIGLKRLLFDKYSDTLLPQIKDKEFIFKLLACCYFEDISKKSIFRITEKLKKQNLTDLENKLDWSLSFITKLLDPIILTKMETSTKLLIKEVPIFLSIITMIYKNKDRIEKNEKYFGDLLLMHLLNDKIADLNFSAKIISAIVKDKKYMGRIDKNEFIERINRYFADGFKVPPKKDRMSNTSQLILSVLRHIKCGDEYDNMEFGHVISKKIMMDFNKDEKTYLSLNTLGNLCMYPTGGATKKPTESLVAYLTEQGKDDTDIYDNYLFLGNNIEYDDIVQRQELTEKFYLKFLKFRTTEMKKILLSAYDKCFSGEDVESNNSDDESNSELSSESESESSENQSSSSDSDDGAKKPTKIKINKKSGNKVIVVKCKK